MQKAIVKKEYDCGISLDGDADRIIMADEKGDLVDGDHILAIAGLDMLKKNRLNKKTLVITDYSNLAVDALMESHGGKTVRTQNGDRYVIEEMLKHGYNLGGEFSGHIIFSDAIPTGDGMIAGLQILSIMQETKSRLSKLGSVLKKYPQVIVNVDVREKRPLEEMRLVQEKILAAEKIFGKDGRHLIRYSGTEMKARVMIEGRDAQLIRRLADEIAESIRKEVGKR